MRVLIFHGYLLRGTGSNIYNVNLAETMVRLGYTVDLFAQDHEVEQLTFVDAIADWDQGSLNVRVLREPVRCTIYRPPIGRILPVYVADKYRHFTAKPFPQLSEEELAFYIESNIQAVEEVVSLNAPDFVLVNHLIMGPYIMKRALSDTNIPFISKIHGSALEYTVKPYRQRFLSYAREGVAAAEKIIVGSRHVAASLSETLKEAAIDEKIVLVPPGIDTSSFKKTAKTKRSQTLAELIRLLEAKTVAGGKEPSGDDVFKRDLEASVNAVAKLSSGNEKVVIYLGKLIVSKGVDLLLAAWPLVLNQEPNTKLVIIGFGAYEAALKEFVQLLVGGDLEGLGFLAEAGRAREGGEQSRLSYLLAFLAALKQEGKEGEYLVTAKQRLKENVLFMGRLEHDELPSLLGIADVVVVPSTFPEAFGMVSIEAAASGAVPLVAKHSGLAEVAEDIAEFLPAEFKDLLTFELGEGSVKELADKLIGLLQLDDDEASMALAKKVSAKFGWEGIVKQLTALVGK